MKNATYRVLPMNLQRFAGEGDEGGDQTPGVQFFSLSDDDDGNDASIFDVDDNFDEFGNAVETPAGDQTPAGGEGQQTPAGEGAQTPPAGDTQTPPEGGDPKPDDQNPDKPAQTPEENARFAQQRREREMQERIEQERQKWIKESPEAQLAQTLAQRYGTTPEALLQVIAQQALIQQAQAQGVTPEVLQRMQALQQQTETASQQLQTTEQQLNEMRFQQWTTRTDNEATQLKQQFPFLSDEDMNAAKEFMLRDLKDPEMALEKAVFALHGPKIAQKMAEVTRQEALAELGGRKSPLPPQGTKPADDPTVTLTDDERAAARAFNMTDEQYVKWSLHKGA